jgi:hypothetical protein
MIALSNALQAVMATKPVSYFHTVKVYDRAGTVIKAVTSHHSNVVLSDNVQYLADGSLQSVSPPSIGTSVDRSQYTLVISDPSINEGVFAETGLVGKKLAVRLCFLAHDTKTPLTNLSDTFLVYQGYGDNTAYKMDTNEIGDVLLQLICSSPMADLDHKKSIYLSRDYIRNRNPNDSSCDMIYGGSGILQLKWGKA